jgi:predicted nuclease of predicted toxin-antitoxin system
VKLLFDQNMSPRLVRRLADIYPDSEHVYMIGLDAAPDLTIWEYARDNEYIIVTRDADFSDLNVMLGFPPKVIWVRRGNCTTGEMEAILRSNHEAICMLAENEEVGIMTLF